MLCNDLEGGSEAQEGADIHIYIYVADACCCKQKLTQHSKAIMLQFKKFKNKIFTYVSENVTLKYSIFFQNL